MTDPTDDLTTEERDRFEYWRLHLEYSDWFTWLWARPARMAGERISARRLAPAFRRWVEKGQDLRRDILWEARRYPELLEPAETAAATAAEVGHLAQLARDAQRAERAYRRTQWGPVSAFFSRRDSWYYNPVARVLLARAAARLDALQQLRESYAQLARERPVLDDAAIGMLARAEAPADDQPAAYLADRTTQLRALLSPPDMNPPTREKRTAPRTHHEGEERDHE